VHMFTGFIQDWFFDSVENLFTHLTFNSGKIFY